MHQGPSAALVAADKPSIWLHNFFWPQPKHTSPAATVQLTTAPATTNDGGGRFHDRPGCPSLGPDSFPDNLSRQSVTLRPLGMLQSRKPTTTIKMGIAAPSTDQNWTSGTLPGVSESAQFQ